MATKENINDIAKEKPTEGAINSGIVDLVCWINRTCPFNDIPAMDDTLIFNFETVKFYQRQLKGKIASKKDLEGIWMKPSVNPFLHMFIEGSDGIALEPDRSSFQNIDNANTTLDVTSIQNIPYKAEQTFVISPGLFETTALQPSKYNIANTEENTDDGRCITKARWQYKYIPKFISFGNRNTAFIQYPQQISGQICKGAGVHWKLDKKTPLFRGEDFLIEFRKAAVASKISISEDNTPLKILHKYDYLDIRSENKKTLRDPNLNNVPVNWGVVDYTEGFAEKQNEKKFDLASQPYYIIEFGNFGDNGNNHHYFLLLVGDNPPRIIRERDGVSFIVDEYTNVKSSSLINSNAFTIAIRNHLGKLHINISVEGSTDEIDWLVERKDLTGRTGNLTEAIKLMLVDRGNVSIMGGHTQVSVLFSPIVYGDGEESLRFNIPENVTDNLTVEEEQAQYLKEQEALELGKKIPTNCEECADQPKFCLWKNAEIGIKLRASDARAEDLDADLSRTTNNASVKVASGEPTVNIKNRGPFSGDAQKIKEFGGKEEWADFMYQQPIKEINRAGAASGAKFSKITVDMIDKTDGPSDNVISFRVAIDMQAGNHTFSSGYTLPACKTPILTMLRLTSKPNKEFSRWTEEGFECSEHVMHFSDSWSTTDFTQIEHTGNLKFLLHMGANYEENHTSDLFRLKDKAFYVEIWAGYKSDATVSAHTDPDKFTKGEICNYSQLPGYYKLFTGMCQGGTLSVEAGQRIMECTLLDYTQVLRDQRFFNSPFYDGVRDFNAVDHVMQLAGFKASGDSNPNSIIHKLANSNNSNEQIHTIVDKSGRVVRSQLFVLPASYARLTQPFFKFEDGSPLLDGLLDMVKKGGKVFFFDAHGVAHLDSYYDLEVVSVLSGSAAPNPLFWFATNPAFHKGQQVFNSVTVQRAVGDVHNQIKMLSNTPNFELILLDDMSYPSVFDPEAEGFIGYPKMFYQREPLFGNHNTARKIMSIYAAMYRPPIVARFETYGQPIRALDIISLDGQTLRVMKVDNTIDPAENKWWQQLECEWLLEPTSEILDQLRKIDLDEDEAVANAARQELELG